MDSRVPGHGRYAHPEREQRWVLPADPDDLHDPVDILDRYLTGTRLRLRRATSADGVARKLGQKVRARIDSPDLVQITNIYLDEPEYDVVAALDAAVLHKTRRRWRVGDRTLAVDTFHGDLEGLVLAEVELGLTDEWLAPPPTAVVEVTFDDRFAGGTLATLTRSEAVALLDWVTRQVDA